MLVGLSVLLPDTYLPWLGEMGYAVGHRPQLAPGKPAAGRGSFGKVVLAGLLREVLRRLNPAKPEKALRPLVLHPPGVAKR